MFLMTLWYIELNSDTVVVTSLFNLVISSFPDNMFYHAWTWLLIYHYGSNNVVQVCSFIKPWTVCPNMHEQACQQHCSSWPAQSCTSLSTTMFKLASSTMFKPVNNTVQAGQLNHVQACQQPCSSWPAQPCTSLSTTMFKLASSTMFKPVNRQMHMYMISLDRFRWRHNIFSSLF